MVERHDIQFETINEIPWRWRALPYAYLGLLAFFALSLIAAFVWFALQGEGWYAVPLLGISAMILASFFVSMPQPDGVLLDPTLHDTLYADIQHFATQILGEAVDEILLSEGMETKVVRVPSRAFFPEERKTFLILSFPIMQTVAPTEWRTLLIRALYQGMFETTLERWEQDLAAAETSPHGASALITLFLRWYVGKLERVSHQVLKSQEVFADQGTVEWEGSRATVAALVRASLARRYLTRSYWPQVESRESRHPYLSLRPTYQGQWSTPMVKAWVEQALVNGLTDRLLPLREPIVVPGPLDVSASELFLGAVEEKIALCFDRKWHERF